MLFLVLVNYQAWKAKLENAASINVCFVKLHCMKVVKKQKQHAIVFTVTIMQSFLRIMVNLKNISSKCSWIKYGPKKEKFW